MNIKEIKALKETLAFATIHKNIIEPKTADQLQRYISQLEADKLEMAQAFCYGSTDTSMRLKAQEVIKESKC